MTLSRLADYLGHMLNAATEAHEFADGMTRMEFLADRRTQKAVVMSLLIVGEAAARILDLDPGFAQAHPNVPWRKMRGMRNRMVHGYFETNFDIVWETVNSEIPQLVGILSAVIHELENKPGRTDMI